MLLIFLFFIRTSPKFTLSRGRGTDLAQVEIVFVVTVEEFVGFVLGAKKEIVT